MTDGPQTTGWQPITSAAQLCELCRDPDHDTECVAGYRDGFIGEPRPGPNRSPSYRHGWFNGDADRRKVTLPEQIELIQSCRRVWGNDVSRWGRSPAHD